MFFIVSKLLSFLIDPSTWIIILLLLGLSKKKQLNQLKYYKIATILFLIFSNPLLYTICIDNWEIKAINPNQMKTFDVGIVLGTTSSRDSIIQRTQFGNSSDRLFQAIDLYKKGKIKKILYCGGSGELMHPENKEGRWIEAYLIQLGIPPADIIIENNSRNTRENALFSKPLLERYAPHGNYILITSGYHMKRAVGCFRKVGITVFPYATDIEIPNNTDKLIELIIPNCYYVHEWYKLNHEIVGYLTYIII